MNEKLKKYLELHDSADTPVKQWRSIIKNAVTTFNQEHGTNYDPHDTFMEYVQTKGQEGEV